LNEDYKAEGEGFRSLYLGLLVLAMPATKPPSTGDSNMRERSHGWFTKLGLGALVLTALAIPCLATERPFKLQGTTAILGNPFAPDGAAMEGNGTATHLGDWTNGGLIFFDGSSGPPFAATGIAHFTAANGDQLDVLLIGTIDTSLVATATYHMVGGTGRFANASGHGDFAAAPNPDGTLSYTATGTIDY
jgi:hypothetical protein